MLGFAVPTVPPVRACLSAPRACAHVCACAKLVVRVRERGSLCVVLFDCVRACVRVTARVPAPGQRSHDVHLRHHRREV